MTTTHYRNLLNTLDEFLGEQIKGLDNIPCCNIPYIRNDGIFDTCVSCGYMKPHNEIIIKKQFLNPKYQLSTCIGYNHKYRNVNRLHKWINYDYRENMSIRNYKEINEMGHKLKLDNLVIENACMVYKHIYIDNKISSRNKIKKSLFVYCLMKSAFYYKKDFDIIKCLKDNSLSIENYNKSLLKVDDDHKLFLNPNMTIQYKKLVDNFESNITLMDIIIEYNKNCDTYKGFGKKRLNNNSILLSSIYILLDLDDDKKFYTVFNITPTTIRKFLMQ